MHLCIHPSFDFFVQCPSPAPSPGAPFHGQAMTVKSRGGPSSLEKGHEPTNFDGLWLEDGVKTKGLRKKNRHCLSSARFLDAFSNTKESLLGLPYPAGCHGADGCTAGQMLPPGAATGMKKCREFHHFLRRQSETCLKTCLAHSNRWPVESRTQLEAWKAGGSTRLQGSAARSTSSQREHCASRRARRHRTELMSKT